MGLQALEIDVSRAAIASMSTAALPWSNADEARCLRGALPPPTDRRVVQNHEDFEELYQRYFSSYDRFGIRGKSDGRQHLPLHLHASRLGIMRIKVHRTAPSCGYTVPIYEYKRRKFRCQVT